MNNVISLSGGKDSTAMLLMMLEKNEPITDIVFFDTGWEFPQMYEHLEKLEAYIGKKITRLHPRLDPAFTTSLSPFDFMFSEYPVKKRATGEVHMIGRGWASMSRRWCTGVKQRAMVGYAKGISHRQDITPPVVSCIGIAADEIKRMKPQPSSPYLAYRYPLIEYGVTEAEALKYCTSRGFEWSGLYQYFNRVSCFCCPLQSISDLRVLREHFPDLWHRMLTMESWLREGKSRRFRDSHTLSDVEKRFIDEKSS